MPVSSHPTVSAAALLVFAVVFGIVTGARSAPPGLPTALIRDARVKEISGAQPALKPGEFWCLNDSGNPEEIYRIGPTGQVLQAVTIRGAENIDWEAMTRDDQGRLVIADIGDNSLRRTEYRLYVLAEPEPQQAAISPEFTVSFRYADGKSRDCESVFFLEGRTYVVTRELPADSQPSVFRLDLIGPNQAEARFVTKLDVRGAINDAVYVADRKQLIVLSYLATTSFFVASEADLSKAPAGRRFHFLGQCEALCVESGELLATNEQGMIWRFPLPEAPGEP